MNFIRKILHGIGVVASAKNLQPATSTVYPATSTEQPATTNELTPLLKY